MITTFPADLLNGGEVIRRSRVGRGILTPTIVCYKINIINTNDNLHISH